MDSESNEEIVSYPEYAAFDLHALNARGAGESDFANSKALLQSMRSGGMKKNEGVTADATTANLYEHLVGVLKYILEKQPSHALDDFEIISYRLKMERGITNEGHSGGIVAADLPPLALELRKKEETAIYEKLRREQTLFRHPLHVENSKPDLRSPLPGLFRDNLQGIDAEAKLPNLADCEFLVDHAGIGLNKTETWRIWLSLRLLAMRMATVEEMRFFGKIQAARHAYYIVEVPAAEAPDGQIDSPWDEWTPKKSDAEATASDNFQAVHVKPLPELAQAFQEASRGLPRPNYQTPAPYPMEERGRGCNKWDYYVTKDLNSEDWVRLPPVQPVHISLSCRARRLFTGDLNAPVTQVPNFPGVEAHYLRAIIARISAGTTIAPAGAYELDEEVEEDETPENLIKSEEMEEMDFADLLQPATWVHIRPYLHRQGRVQWMPQREAYRIWREEQVAAGRMGEDADDVEGEMEEPEEEKRPEAPEILAPIDNDRKLRAPNSAYDPVSAWKIRPSTCLLPKNCAVAILESNRWPGAYVLARQKKLLSIYVGWGIPDPKATDYQPVRHPKPLQEYEIDRIGLKESLDPTPLEEKAFHEQILARKRALAEQVPEEEVETEGEDEGGAEEEGEVEEED